MQHSTGYSLMAIVVMLFVVKTALGLEVAVNAQHPQAGAGSNITSVNGVWPYLFNGSNTGNIYLAFNESAAGSLNVNSSTFAQNSTYSTNSTYALNASYADNSNASIFTQNASYATSSNSSDYSNRTVYWDGSDSKQDVVQWCYQGLVNKSTSCGGLGYGVYLCGDNWTDCNLTIDGDMDTYSTQGDYNQYIYINTTFPSNFLSDSLMQTKDGLSDATTNNTIISFCDLKQFRLFGHNSGGGITPYHIYYQCWNTTDWYNVRTKSCASPCRVYDVAWWLHLNNTEQNKISYGEANESYLQKNGNGSQLTEVNADTAGVAVTALYLEGFTYGNINESAYLAAKAYSDLVNGSAWSGISGVQGSLATTNGTVNLINANYQNKSVVIANATFANLAGNSLTFDGETDFGAIGQDIIPSADNSINLGSASYRWANAYVNQITPTGVLNITANNIVALSSTAGNSVVLQFNPSANISRGVGLVVQYVTETPAGLIYVAIAAADKQIVPAADNAYSLGTANYRWSDLRSVLINGADYCFQNNLCLTECVINDVQDICVVAGLPTKEQAEIMGLADVKDYNEYKIRVNGTLKEANFNIQKSKGLKDSKKDFVFGRRIITSMGEIGAMRTEIDNLKKDVEALKAKVK